MPVTFIATQTRRIFGVEYARGDEVDVTGLSSRALGRAIDKGLVAATLGGGSVSTSSPLTLTSTDAGGLDTFDSTSRLTVQSHQTNGNNFFGEGVRLDLMRPMAKNMIAWRMPRDPGFDDPATLRSVAWIGAHYYAQDQADPQNPTDVHGHWSLEIPDAADALRTRLEIGFTKPDGSIGVAKTNIKTNLADLTVRAENSQVLRVGAGNSHHKDLVFAIDDGTSGTGARWLLRTDNTTETAQNDGSDFRLMSANSDGSTATRVFVRRKDGRVHIGGQTTSPVSQLHVGTAAAAEPLLHLENTHTTPTSPLITALAGASSGTLIQSGVVGESVRRFSSNMSGRMEWGSGAATRDVVLYRDAADRLATEDDFELKGSTRGVILTAPDATRWRVRVANGGTLTVTAA